MGTRSERKSGIELLRLVAILGIVLSHWGGHGSWELTADNSLLTSKVYLQLTQFFGEVGNCLFVLITGYFCAFREKIRKETIVRLVTDVKFYSLIIYSVIIIIGINEFTIGGLVTALFPFVYKMYWFILPYLVVFAISPWLNYILASSSKSTLYWFFGSLVAVELFFPIIRATTVASNVGLFILIYCVGAMLRRSEKFYSFIKKCKWGGVILGFGIAISSLYVLDLITAKISLAPEYSSLLIERFSPLPLITAIGIFSIFSGFTFHSKIINRIASSAFSIYLISEHPSIYPWLWKKYFNNMVVYDNTFNLIAYSFIQCLIVMMFCIIIDIIYKWFKQFLFSLIDLNTGN